MRGDLIVVGTYVPDELRTLQKIGLVIACHTGASIWSDGHVGVWVIVCEGRCILYSLRGYSLLAAGGL